MPKKPSKKKVIKRNNTKNLTVFYTENHPLFLSIYKKLSEIMSSNESLAPKNRKGLIKYKKGEHYIVNCFRAMVALKDRSRQFEEAMRFIEERPAETLLKRYKMSHLEYFDYHHNALLTYYTSFPECVYQAVNFVLNLGIGEKQVTYVSLENHKWVRDTGLTKEIKALDKLRTKHAFDRNQAIHLGRSKIIEELNLHFSMDFLADYPVPDGNLKEEIKWHRKTRRKIFKWDAKLVLKPIKSDFDEMWQICERIFDKLNIYFDFWTDKGSDFASLPRTFKR